MKHLHTGQFKQVYKEVKTPLPHVNFLILGFLVWLEQHYLDYTIKANLDSAIDDYHKQMDRLKNDKNLWSRYTYAVRSDFPRCQPCYYRQVSRNESRKNHESQRNKDALDTCVSLDCLSVGVPVLRLMRFTIMCDACDSNNTVWDCSNLNTISAWTAIIST